MTDMIEVELWLRQSWPDILALDKGWHVYAPRATKLGLNFDGTESILVPCSISEIESIRDLASQRLNGKSVCYVMDITYPFVPSKSTDLAYYVWGEYPSGGLALRDSLRHYYRSVTCMACGRKHWRQKSDFSFKRQPDDHVQVAANSAVLVSSPIAHQLESLGAITRGIEGVLGHRQVIIDHYMPITTSGELPLSAHFSTGFFCEACGIFDEFREPSCIEGPIGPDLAGNELLVRIFSIPVFIPRRQIDPSLTPPFAYSLQGLGGHAIDCVPEGIQSHIFVRNDIARALDSYAGHQRWRNTCFV